MKFKSMKMWLPLSVLICALTVSVLFRDKKGDQPLIITRVPEVSVEVKKGVLQEKSLSFVRERLTEIQSGPVNNYAVTALSIFEKDQQNIFFDKQNFFSQISMTLEDLDLLGERLKTIEGLDDVVFEGAAGAIPERIKTRMAVNDFLFEYAKAHPDSTDCEFVKELFKSLAQAPIQASLSLKIKRILVGEKTDQVKALTMLDRAAAVEFVKSLPLVLKNKLLYGYYLGLQASVSSSFEYDEWVKKVLES